jgi:HAD superfamily hydrolase (TIGR01509 family)
MGRLSAIIFDMDGTLADTEEIHRQAFNVAFEEFNIPCHWSQEEYKVLLSISGGRERIKQYLNNHKLVPNQSEGVSSTALAVEIHNRKSEIYRQKLRHDNIDLRPGVKRLIHEAKKNNIRLAIATSSSRSNVDTLLLTALGKDAHDLFEVIVTCDIVETKKPSPAVYDYVLVALGLSPENCIAIEDTHNGNQAALAAGIATIITTHLFTTDDFFDGASLVVDQLGEPDTPMSVVLGEAVEDKYVDLSVLERILENSQLQGNCKHDAIAAK